MLKQINYLHNFHLVSLLHCPGYLSHIVRMFIEVRYGGIIIIIILNDFALHGVKLFELSRIMENTVQNAQCYSPFD